MTEANRTEDLVSRLRKEYAEQSGRCGEEDSQDRALLAQAAADEIEMLRRRLNNALNELTVRALNG